MGWFSDNETKILNTVRSIQQTQATQLTLVAIGKTIGNTSSTVNGLSDRVSSINLRLLNIERQLAQQKEALDKLIALLTPSPDVVSFDVTETAVKNKQERIMSKMKDAAVDLQIQDDGTVKYVFTPKDSMGQTTTLPAGVVPSYSSSDPALGVSPDPADTTGLTAIGKPSAIATGIVVTISVTKPDGTTVTKDAPPVDIVPGTVSSFAVAESAG